MGKYDRFMRDPGSESELHRDASSESDEHDFDAEAQVDDFKAQLNACLDDVEYGGTFSAFRQSKVYANPGLYVNNYGSVGLPLATRDAENITRICKQSPFGKGSDTIIDTSIQKTWELDASEFHCQNPAWTAQVNSLLAQVVEDLGVKVPTIAEPYKLLLYEEGAFFKAHKDSEKVPGMFGTMVISLPSEHSGGDVQLNHNGTTRTLATAPASTFDLTTLAWYSDVSHEVQPVTSGYRLVITYNLVQQDTTMPMQTAGALHEKHTELETMLKIWPKTSNLPSIFILPLSHEYTEVSLSLKSLKGPDAAKGKLLQQVCQKSGVYWFLGNLTKTTSEDLGYYDDEEETSYSLDNIVTPAGKSIKLDLNLEAKNILADDLYDGRNADSEDEGEYTGNEGMASTYRYRDTVAILVNKDAFRSQRMMLHGDAASLQNLIDLIRSDTTPDIQFQATAMQMVFDSASWLLTTKPKYSLYAHVPLAEPKNRELFITAANYCHSIGLTKLVRDSIDQMQRWAVASMISVDLLHIFANEATKDASDGIVDAWNTWFTKLPFESTYEHVNDIKIKFEMFKKEMSPDALPSFEEWERNRLESMLQSVRTISLRDVDPLIALIPTIPPSTYFEEIIPRLVTGHGDLLSLFMRRLASGMSYAFSHGTPGAWEHTVRTTYEKVFTAPGNPLKLTSDDFSYRSNIFMQEFLEMLDVAMLMKMDRIAAELLQRAWPDTPGLQHSLWTKWWKAPFMFVIHLLDIVEKYDSENLNRIAASLIPDTLTLCINALARQCPQEPKDWARKVDGTCNCGPCEQLNTFVRHPRQEVAKFSFAAHIRKHLQWELNQLDYTFNTEKNRSPHTLVIHKTKHGYVRELEQWKDKLRLFRSEVTNMTTPFTQKLLPGVGADLQRRCDACLPPGTSSTALQTATSSTLNSRTVAPVAGVKRKANVVDLTGDASD